MCRKKQRIGELTMPFTVGGIPMSLPIILGAGAAKHPSKVVPYLAPDAPLGAAVSGSYTPGGQRDGNTGDLQYPADLGELERLGFGLNAWGMPNIGLDEAVKLFPEQTKPHIISVAAFSADGYADMFATLKGNKRISGVKGNKGCPNAGHLPVAYNLEDAETLLKIARKARLDVPVWWKLSTYMTKGELAQFAREHPHLNFESTPTVADGFVERACDLYMRYADVSAALVVGNTVPNVVYRKAITVRNKDGSVHHKGGLSGPILRPHNLKLIKRMVATGIKDKMDIIGCGGILAGDDAMEYFDVGCAAVECTSGPAWSDVKFFQHMLEGSERLQGYLTEKDN